MTLREDRGLGVWGVSDEEIARIAEENAVVTADVMYENHRNRSPEHLVATQNDDWLVVF
jgi:hypothetical protein